MTDENPDAVLARAFGQIEASHETVPWLKRLYLPSELVFRPLPTEMLVLLQASEDFSMPEPGEPVLVNIFSEDGEAGVLLFLHPTTAILYALVPDSDDT